nr:site-specific DNA-methyltransferase [Luteibacter rhizovicinus]
MNKFKRVKKWSSGPEGSQNAIVHGDNLGVLRELAQTHSGAVKCVYLDPPYNNGETYLHYLDSLGHDEWLAAVTARLLAIKDLLREDGSVWISIDDSELHYLRVACDTVFGRKNFVGTVVWERRTTRENRKAFSRNHEYLLVYAANSAIWAKVRNLMPISEEIAQRYKNPDKDARGAWQSVSANVQAGHATPQQFYGIAGPSGRIHQPPNGRCWVYAEPKMREEIRKNNIWFGKDGNSAPRIKSFLVDRKGGVVPETLWRAADVGTTTEAKRELIALFNEEPLFDTPKPERLIQRVLDISTSKGDIVLDAYLGSGTTAAVAHKMGRHYLGIEVGDHAMTHCALRLKAVVDGEAGGISPLVGWAGGGGFDFLTFSAKEVKEK